MKINITKKEYELILNVFEIAEWMMNSYKVEEDSETKKYIDLQQKIFSYAKEFGL